MLIIATHTDEGSFSLDQGTATSLHQTLDAGSGILDGLYHAMMTSLLENSAFAR